MLLFQPSVTISPEEPLIDEQLEIIITGLSPHQQVTIHLHETGVPGGIIEGTAHAVFTADHQGEIHLSTQKPLSGTYEEADPMGLFWSQQIATIRFNRSLQLDNLLFEPRFSQVTITVTSEEQEIARKEFTRNFLSPQIHVQNVRENGLVAKFFYNPESPPAPAIIVVGGSEGGLTSSSIWAGLFASHGYPALALAYFQCEDLPDDITNIPLEYVKTAINWLQQQDTVIAERIGMFGRSKGAELSLICGATFPEIKAVMAFSPTSVVSIGSCGCSDNREHHPTSSWSYLGEPLPFVIWTEEQCAEALRNIGNSERFDHVHRTSLSNSQLATEKAAIPVEMINGPIMLVSSNDDHYWPADWHCEQMVKRLQHHLHPHPVLHLTYDNVGHGIRYPYIQTTLLRMNGGTAPTNASASKDSYEKLLEFLRVSL